VGCEQLHWTSLVLYIVIVIVIIIIIIIIVIVTVVIIIIIIIIITIIIIFYSFAVLLNCQPKSFAFFPFAPTHQGRGSERVAAWSLVAGWV